MMRDRLHLIVVLCILVILSGCTSTHTTTVRKDGVVREITVTRKGMNVVEIDIREVEE